MTIQYNMYKLNRDIDIESTRERLLKSPMVQKVYLNEGNDKKQGIHGSLTIKFIDIDRKIWLSKKAAGFAFASLEEKQKIMSSLFLHDIKLKQQNGEPEPTKWSVMGDGWPPPKPLQVLGCKGYVYNIMEPVKNVFKVRRGVHPLLWWFVYVGLPILSVLPQFLKPYF